MVFTNKTVISLHPLKIRKDQKNYVVEDEVTGDFYEMPEVCITAMELINQKKRLDEIEDILSAQFPDEDVDVIAFVNQLFEIDLVSELDGEKVPRSSVLESNTGFSWIPPGFGRLFFNPFSSKVFIGLLSISITLILLKPDLYPNYTDLFIFDMFLSNIVAWMVITFLLVLLHEIGHVLAARSEGLPAKIELGNRLFLIVLETNLTQVWELPAERRNRIYLAGMYVDMVVLFFALAGQFFIETSLINSLLKLIVLNAFIRLVFQSAVFMKTDLYYVMENITGCYNLMENGQNFLAKWLPFLRVSQTETFAGEEKIVRRYAGFYLAGVVITIAITAYYYIPQLIFAVNQIMLPGFSEPIGSMRFWDSVVFLLQIVLVMGLLLYSWTKKYRYSS